MTPPAAVSARLRASWRRSEDLEVPPDEVLPVYSAGVDVDPLFVDSGRTVLTELRSSLAGEAVGVMLTDATGLVLQRFLDDASMHRSLDRVHLAPGFSYAEAHAGTNGLGLALADRAPSLVRGPEHYVEALREYTCAAAPVLDPRTGDVAGTVNLTTWSRSASGLLLALATSAARTTSALMLARSGTRGPRPPGAAPAGSVAGLVSGSVVPAGGEGLRGQVYRVLPDRAAGPEDPCTSRAWLRAVETAGNALSAGRVLALAGGPGAGKTALVASARRRSHQRGTLLAARTPAPEHVGAWLAAWMPVLQEHDACIVVSGTAALPAWAVDELAGLLRLARHDGAQPQPFVLTGHDAASLPAPLAALVDVVVEVPPLRHRPEDVVPLAHHFARAHRHRDVEITPAAARALSGAPWPGGTTQLRSVVRVAAARTDVVDVQHLPPEVLAAPAGSVRRLTHLEAVERDEIVKALAVPGTTVARAAEQLGISRATVYRRVSRYGIEVPRR